MQKEIGIGVLGKLTRHGTNHSKFINHRAHAGKKIAHRGATLSVLLKFPRTREQISNGIKLRGIDLEELPRVLAGILRESRLWIEAVDLRHATIHI